VWKGRIVSESTLTSRINAARKAIGDSGEAQTLIRTLARKGMRFIGAVREGDAPASPALASPPVEPASAFPALPDRPSIAVLAFQNMSSNAEDDYFADGIAEDIITALSRFKSLFVIARNSSFTYRGRAVDIKQVGRELGVRYVLEGSVRRASGRVRITGQLIDSASGAHLWADRFDGSLDDVFDLQDRVTASVVGAIAPKIDQAERERARRKPVENLDAYDCFLRGLASHYEHTKESCETALQLFYRAMELDPGFATPCGMATRCYADRKSMGWIVDKDAEAAEIRRLAMRVSLIGRDDALALAWAGFSMVWICREYDRGAALVDQALSVNQNLAVGWINRGFVSIYQGQHEAAIEQLLRAIRLSPMDPEQMRTATALAFAHLLQDRHEDALVWAARAVASRPDWMAGWWASALANAYTGRLDEARRSVVRIRQLNPKLHISSFPELIPFQRSEDIAFVMEGFRLAGLPE
jgi:TolB-like protein/tetratricopeptide (TPR) repeat protein